MGSKIAVIGAAGFVGRELLSLLEQRNIQATAIVRGLPELSVSGNFHRAMKAEDARAGEFDVVINLAYPTAGAAFEQADQNTAILDTVQGLVNDGGHLIQVSTLAVFGMTFDRPAQLGPAPKIRDVPYVESKIDAEHFLTREQPSRGWALDIVRLGNVWGRASGAWALPLTHRLVTGRPLGIKGATAYSNTTDVRNVVDYLLFLATSSQPSPQVRFHHLAEFSSVKWPEWIAPLADALNVQPTYSSPASVSDTSGPRGELRAALRPVGVRRLYSELAGERASGSYLRTAIRRIPEGFHGKLRSPLVFAAEPTFTRSEQIFQLIMSAEQEFKSSTLPGWSPPVDRAESMAGVLSWLAAG